MTKGREERCHDYANDFFDLIIVGGGITGSGIVRDATLRGMKCLLIDKGDFSSGTSSKSGKLIHGGLRYLKYFHLGLVFESCFERHRLLKVIAPHIVRHVRFLYPFYKKNKLRRWVAAMGLFAYGGLSLFRNVQRFKFISKEKLFKLEPEIRREGSVGGLAYSDCAALDTRLTIDTLKSAADAGAQLLNYCEMTQIVFKENKTFLKVRDQTNQREYEFQAQVAVNAGGAWADEILNKSPQRERFKLHMTCGLHLIFNKEKCNISHTMALESPIDGRGTYVVPWANNILVGTTDIFYDGDKDHIPIRDQSVEYLLDLINHYFPKFHLQKRDIQGVFVGIRPLIGSDKGRDEDRVSRDYQILVDARGLVSITGGKLTSYRSMAKKALNEIIRYFFKNRKFNKCQTVSPISGGDVENLNREKLYKKFNHITISKIDSLILRYGTNAEKILYYTQGNSSKGEHIQKGMPYLWAEIDYMVGYEYVEKLSDVLFRRANIFHILEDNGYALCEPIARYMAPLMGWDANRVEREVQEYRGYLKEIFQGLNKPYIEQLQKERVS